ncbi:MAG: ribonuclease HII [Parcubacteria group bacterium]|nr:ribonuclease HII [Parcubacteria group bacterium]
MKSLAYTKERELLQKGFVCVAGVDEVGAGCLAGDVFAAAVVLKPGAHMSGVQDSKRLSASAREYWDGIIREKAVGWAIGRATPKEIDEINIRQASFLAMRRALDQLDDIDHVLSDGFVIPDLLVSCTRVIKGDTKIKSIAAASIVAKVARDAYMCELSLQFPQYGFDRHKGYGTVLHRNAISKYGLLDIHRKSFCNNFV